MLIDSAYAYTFCGTHRTIHFFDTRLDILVVIHDLFEQIRKYSSAKSLPAIAL